MLMKNTRFFGIVNPLPTEGSVLGSVPFSTRRKGSIGKEATLRHMWCIGTPDEMLKKNFDERLSRFDPLEDLMTNFSKAGVVMPFEPIKDDLLYLYKPTIDAETKSITLGNPVSFEDSAKGVWVEGTQRTWRSDLYLIIPKYYIDPNPYRKNRVIFEGFHQGNSKPLKCEVEFVLTATMVKNITQLLFSAETLKNIA